MHPINKGLSVFGLQLSRTRGKIPRQSLKNYQERLSELRKNPPQGFDIFKAPRDDAGAHPVDFRDFECGFTARHVNRLNPESIMDIGSYRHFILGLLAGYKVTTVDVRTREAIFSNEVVITSDAKKLELPDNQFDVVISLCALEHFGLGRYGDEIELDADKKAFNEMVRVLKPNGRLIFSTTITRARPAISFNAHRIYNYDMIKAFCAGLTCEEERVYLYKIANFGPIEEVTIEPNAFDTYCGCWKK